MDAQSWPLGPAPGSRPGVQVSILVSSGPRPGGGDLRDPTLRREVGVLTSFAAGPPLESPLLAAEASGLS